MAGCSVHGIVNAADKTLNITGDHQHDLDGDYLQSTRFRRDLKKQISTHDCDVKEVYNRVAEDYGPNIRTLVPFAQVKKNLYRLRKAIPPPDQKCPNCPGFRSRPWAIVVCGHVFVGPVHTNFSINVKFVQCVIKKFVTNTEEIRKNFKVLVQISKYHAK